MKGDLRPESPGVRPLESHLIDAFEGCGETERSYEVGHYPRMRASFVMRLVLFQSDI